MTTTITPEIAGRLCDIDLNVLGERIRNARVAKGLTQEQVGAGLASTAYISRIESGQRRPDGRLLARIAERLDTTLEQLLCPAPPPALVEALGPVLEAVEVVRAAVEQLSVALAELLAAQPSIPAKADLDGAA